MLRRCLVAGLLGAAVAEDTAAAAAGPPALDLPDVPHLFLENFQNGMDQWVLSGGEKYRGQPAKVKARKGLPAPFHEDASLLLEKANKHYGLAAPFTHLSHMAENDLVVQYELTLSDGLHCGGAYLKVLTAVDDLDLSDLENHSPYTIMFGPDKCGDTNKVHFIFRHKNPVSGDWVEHHLKDGPKPIIDTATHLYTLVVRADNTYEIMIDRVTMKHGSLLEDFDPPVNPAKVISDPNDVKPVDWVDEPRVEDEDAVMPDDWDEDAPERIPDPDAEKPAGWLDDAPDFVPEPGATMPVDWDEDEDGMWEAPLVANPACKTAPGCGEWERPMVRNKNFVGPWYPPMIDNPDYIGEWAPREMENPHHFENFDPHDMADMGAVAIEIWTTNGGIMYDNLLVTMDESAAREYGIKTWSIKAKAEAGVEKTNKRNERKAEKELLRKEGGMSNMIEVYVSDGLEWVAEHTGAATAGFVVLLVSLIFGCRGSPEPEPVYKAPPREEFDEAASGGSEYAAGKPSKRKGKSVRRDD